MVFHFLGLGKMTATVDIQAPAENGMTGPPKYTDQTPIIQGGMAGCLGNIKTTKLEFS